MSKIYPNLTAEQHGKAMNFAFWFFSLTCIALVMAVVGIKSGAISQPTADLIRSLMGPVLGINIGLLIYLADRDWGMARQQSADNS